MDRDTPGPAPTMPDGLMREIGEAGRRPGSGESLNLGEPSRPRLAASIVLLRRGSKHSSRGLEVLMTQRTEKARFMPGVWVFPGGALDAEDGRIGEEPGGSGGADRDGSNAGRQGDGIDALRACAVRELAEEAGIALPPDEELVLFSHWITPEAVKTRFDARFFMALAPRHSPPRPDGGETVDARWVTPRGALDAHAEGDMGLTFPTLRQLESLLEFPTSEAAIAAYRERTVEPILPKPIEGPDGITIALPGDDNYPA